MTPPLRRRSVGRPGSRRAGRSSQRVTVPGFGPARDPSTPHVCYLHIGTMKSGTTFLQHMLAHHHQALAEDGVLFPGRGKYMHQILAVRDLLGLPGAVAPARLEGAWDGVRREIAEWPGATSIISVEHLSIATPKQVPAIVESLAPATVHVVLTARDLARVLPSTWQENVQNGLTWTWPGFMESVMDLPGAEPKAGQRFWRQQDLVKIARRWSEAIGAEHFHLVTVPPPGAPRDLLWQRFCGVMGLDAARYPIEGATLRSNLGLDRTSAEMLRRVNARLDHGVDLSAKQRILKRGLAKSVLVDADHELPIVLDADEYAWTRRTSTRLVTELAATGIDIVGNLAELVPPERVDTPTDHFREPTDAEIADSAAAAVAALLGQLKTARPGRGQPATAEDVSPAP